MLSSAAPQPNGTTVTLSADPSASGSVTFSTMSVTIPAGNTTGTFAITGARLGTAGILANAPGSPTASANVLVVMLGAISISNNLAVTVGQSATLSVRLSTPAPPDGVTVTLQSGDTNTLTVSPTTVTISARATTPSVTPQVTGVAGGSTTITASSGGYISDTETVTVSTLSLPCPAITSGQVNVPFGSQVSATGGVTPYTYSVVGSLPIGLTLDPSSGAITGTPTLAGSFSILVTDTTGSVATSCLFTIN